VLWMQRAADVNARLRAAGLPLEVANMSSVWSLIYTRPSRYNWMLQFYLRAEGLALSWVGTGRLIFPIDLSHEDFAEIAARIVTAAVAMERDGWWWSTPELTNQAIKRRLRRETLLRLRRRGAFRDSGLSTHPEPGKAAPSSRA